MRDGFYGDKRDIVKWGALLVLCQKRSIRTVLQVALYRPDRPCYRLMFDQTPEPLPVEVIRHFRDMDRIGPLATVAGISIELHKDQHARLGDGDWENSTKTEFCQAVGSNVPVEKITCKEIANDVAFFAVHRSSWPAK